MTASTAAAAAPMGAITHLIPAGVDLSDPVSGFAETARLLAGPRGDDRWAVLMDDLHLLDKASNALLRHLLDAGAIRLIATVRTGGRSRTRWRPAGGPQPTGAEWGGWPATRRPHAAGTPKPSPKARSITRSGRCSRPGEARPPQPRC
ncbi:hypothetical protein [Streptomyces sp. NPDC002588]|uniref:hypothetical protein n=1 Tax=Streptomyces sp. NPDC002588 TaxID=3154419 RepID=UPI00331DE1E1